MDVAVLSVKSFLKYYKEKYKISDFVFKYLDCFERIKKGGKPIPDDDFNLFMEQFGNIKSESLKNELCFIVFYLCSTTKLRLGTILNLRRDCIINIDEEKNVGTIQFYSKTSDRNFETEILTLNCINFIKQANLSIYIFQKKTEKSILTKVLYGLIMSCFLVNIKMTLTLIICHRKNLIHLNF